MNHLGILLLVGAAYAGPVRQDNIQGGEICATSCAVLPDSKYNYEVGKSYVYNYEAETETAIHGVGNDATGLWFTAVVTIKVLQPCDMVLSLENVEFYSKVNGERVSSDASRQFKVAAEAWPLYFAFANGHVEHVCPETDDPRWIVNIKKGILSAIQNTMPNLDNRHSTLETDVNGICPTEYTLKSGGWANWGQSVITKVKDLSNCRERHSTRTALKTIPFHTDETQSMPLVSSTHECEQNIFRGSYINSIVCRERHTFRPFSQGDSGATTATSQQLVFVREKRSISQTARGRRPNKQPLTFVHEDIADGNDDDERNAARATRALADLCSLTQEDMRPEAPQKFSQLVYTMRQLSRGALSSLYVQIQSESVCAENKYRGRKFFLDALPLCATSGAIGVMVDIMEAGDLSTAENDAWLVGMALNTQTTTEQMLTEGKRLLEWTPPPRRGFLTVGTMVHNFCKDKPDCAEVPIVREIISMLEANLRYRCRPGGEEGDEKKILMSLKALGNAGVLIGSYDNLRACITDGESPIEMRLAAIDAMHRLPCDNDRYNRQPLLRVYEQISAPDEVRIAAYLGAMHCATNDVIDNVVEMLLNEPMNQVGSFVWTHLTNIAESSSPLKQEVRKHLLHSDLKQRFSSDARKFSRAYEGSFFSPLLQSGASVEAHTIFSRDSFLPRSGMLNVSVDVFGSSLNLFELGGRVEGLDRTIASMFQPGGYFSDIAEPVSSGEIADRRMSRLHQAYDARMVDTTSGSFYYKIMGNEIDFFDLESLKELGKINTISMMIELAKEHSYDASMSSMFLDTEMRVPTGTGIPIHLTLNGTFTVDLSLRGKLDLRQIFISPRSFNIDGHIKPSGAVEIAGLMVTDATVARTGVRTVATLHSSTAIEGRVQLQDGEVFNVDLKMPRDKLEILDVSSKIYSVHQEGEVEVVGVVEGRTDETLCTGDRLARFLGMQLCAEVAFPNATLQEAAPWYPFTGPSRVAITLEKTDKTFTDYQFEARWQKQKVRKDGKTYNTFTGRLSMDTPGSSIDREWTTDLVVNQADLAFSANLRSPYKKLGLEGSAINEPALKRGSVTLTVDRNTQYVLTGQFQSEKIGDFVRFSPFLVFEAPNRPQVTLQGKLDYTREAKLDVDLSITELTATPITLRGQVEKSGNSKNRQLNIDMTFTSPIAEFEVAGNVKQFKQNYQTRFQVSHRLGASGRKETTTIAYKLRDTSTDEQLEYTETGSFKSTAWPDYDVHAYELTLTKSKTRRYWNTMMYVKYGIQERELTLRHMFDDASNATDLIYATLASVTIPHRGIYWSLNANHAHGDKYLNTAVDVGYARNKKLAGRLTLTSERAPSRLNGQLQFTYPGREITSQATIEKVRPGLFDLTWTTAWDIGRQVVVTSQLERFPGETYDGESVLVTVGLPDRDPISVRVQKKWVHASNQNSWEFVLRPNSNDEYMMKAVLERPSKSEKIIQVSATRPGHSTVTTLKMKDGPKKVTEVDIRWDELHVTVVAGMQDYSIVSGQYLRTFSLDVAPDAGHRPEEKLSVSGNVTYPCALNTLCIPRKVEATARWARDQVIYTVITQDIVAWNDMQFSARVETPFNPLRMATFTQVVRTDVPGTILTSVEYNSYNQQMAHRSEIALASDRTTLAFSSVQNGNEYANVGLTAYFRGSVRLEGTMAVSTPQTRHSADGSFELRNGSPTLEFTYNKDRHEYVYAKTSMSWPDSGMTLYRYRGDVVFDASFTGSGSYDLERVASSMDVRVNAPLYVDDLRVVYEASLATRRGFLLSGNVRMAGRETCRFNSDITGIRSGEFSYVHLGEPILAFRWTGNDETSPSIQFRRAVDFTMSAPYDYGVRFDVSKVMTDSLKLDVEFAVSTYGTELASVTATLGPTPFTGLIVTNYKGQQQYGTVASQHYGRPARQSAFK
ncbi:PREDICTED: apolipophorins-like [Priapulus caudatus]|uniref:Apolipophorins-like n=1 Tax=Priapulus caudatus TaxID=37621 RepID=A0ABM1EBT3_PRICU|nr:PREDICTED: apolipophorins-like [Priapulus caudatus]